MSTPTAGLPGAAELGTPARAGAGSGVADRRGRLEGAAALALSGGAAAAFVAAARWLVWPVVDDAGIAFAYGRTLFEGYGPRLTPNSQLVEGFSSPLHVLLLGVLSAVSSAEPESLLRWSGLVVGAAGVFSLGLWGSLADGRRPQLQDAVPPWLAVSVPSLVGWTASGMETGLVIASFSVAGALALRAMRLGQGTAAGAAVGLLAWVRPESALFAAAIVPLWLASALAARRPLGRELRQPLLPAAAVAGALVALRWWIFADVVPNTYWAKRGWDFNARSYMGSFLEAYWPLAAACVAAGLLATVLGWSRARRALLALAFGAAPFAFAWSSKGDWMGEWRFLAPSLPFAAVAVEASLSGLRAQVAGARGVRRAAWAFLALGVAGASAFGAFRAAARFPQVKASPQFPLSFVSANARALVQELAALGQRRALLVVPDVGGLGLEARDAEVMDAAGLADRPLALGWFNFPLMEDYLTHEGPPLVVDAHGPSGHLANLRTLLAGYVPRGPYFWLKDVTRDEDPRCPGGKASVLALDPDALVQALERDVAQGAAVVALRRWRCAYTYQPEERLPSRRALEKLVREADARSRALEAEDRLEEALRHASLATVLAGQDGHLRRRTEKLRARLHPKGPGG